MCTVCSTRVPYISCFIQTEWNIPRNKFGHEAGTAALAVVGRSPNTFNRILVAWNRYAEARIIGLSSS